MIELKVWDAELRIVVKLGILRIGWRSKRAGCFVEEALDMDVVWKI